MSTRCDVVRDLPAAASVWLMAALGIACGAGLPALAVATTVEHLVIMFVFPMLVRHPDAGAVRQCDLDPVHLSSCLHRAARTRTRQRKRSAVGHPRGFGPLPRPGPQRRAAVQDDPCQAAPGPGRHGPVRHQGRRTVRRAGHHLADAIPGMWIPRCSCGRMASACWPREALKQGVGPSTPKRILPVGRCSRHAQGAPRGRGGPPLQRSSGHHCSGLLKPTAGGGTGAG